MTVLDQLKKMRDDHIQATGSPPATLKMGRGVLDAVAATAPWPSRRGMQPEEWIEHVRAEARAGNFRLFGIQVELCE